MIVFITGTMFSSKSKEWKNIASSATYNNSDDVLVFKPSKDTRDDGYIESRSGKRIQAIKIDSLLEIPKYITESTTDIFIDEINFLKNIRRAKSFNWRILY